MADGDGWLCSPMGCQTLLVSDFRGTTVLFTGEDTRMKFESIIMQ